MNLAVRRSIRSITAALLLLAAGGVSSATTVVFSNLMPESEVSAFRVVDSNGSPLPAGSLIRLGYFGNLSPAEISALSQQGKDALMAAFTPFGSAFVIGTGSNSTAGRFEFSGNAAASNPQQGLHAVVINAASPAAATEWMVAALPGTVPADDPSGLLGYLAVHLQDATLVVGTAEGNQFATVGQTSSFESWMENQAISELPPEKLLPNADADNDGVANLVEYALGSLAGDSTSRAGTDLIRDNGVLRLRFLSRNDDPKLSLTAETCANLATGTWEGSPHPAVAVPSPPSSAPAGFIWLQVELPVSGERLFARVRANLNP